MESPGVRAHILANCKCLYGPDIEVLTLYSGSSYQALAMRFDPYTASWTKFLHSKEDAGSTDAALRMLLMQTEIELAKLFSANGISIPFSEDSVQTMTLHREVRRYSGASSNAPSDESEYEVIATPESISEEEAIVHATPSDARITEQKVETESTTSQSWQQQIPIVNDTVYDEALCEIEEVACEEESASPCEPEEVVCEEASGWLYEREEAICEEVAYEEVSEFPCEPEQVVCEEETLLVVCDDPKPVDEEEETVPEAYDYPKPVDEEDEALHEVYDDFKEVNYEEETLPEAYEPLSEEMCEPNYPETEPEPAVEEMGEPDYPETEPEPAVEEMGEPDYPETEPEPAVEEMGEPDYPETEPEPAVEEMGEPDYPETEPEPAVEEICEPDYTETEHKPEVIKDGGWWPPFVSYEEDRAVVYKKLAPPNPPLSETPSVEILELRVAPEVEEPQITSAPPPPEAQPEATTHRTQPAAGQTVVLTIFHTSKTSMRTFTTMVNLAENTKAAILHAVNSYLDSHSSLVHVPGERKIEIKSGAGKNGDLDLFALDESKWPEYLEYLCQYTKLPELKVEVVDVHG